MKKDYLKKAKLPDAPGVYLFKKGNTILYIGKTTSLRDRVRSYFSSDIIATRGPLILDMTVQATTLDWQETDSVLEALILEASLIKKHQPKYNTKEKDNKSFNYVVITREVFPSVLVLRGRNLAKEVKSKKYQAFYGPFPNGMQLRDAMKIIRRIFPYSDAQSVKKDNREFYRQLGLAPDEGVASDAYTKTIKNLKLFFEGKKKSVIVNLKKEMNAYAKKYEFERASEMKKRIFAIEHINDVALIKSDSLEVGNYKQESNFRIEAYDIAHLSGKNMVGVMTVVINGEVAKSEYKKFIIRTQTGANDTGALEEVLSRRFRHTEWGLPNLVVVDGSTAQIYVAQRVLNRYQFDIPIVSVVKDDRHKAKAIMNNEAIAKAHKKSIILANNEAHRFGITFHRTKQRKDFLH
ncbi:MAG: GIY-YIG nuclease family protein [Candidatus Pacebacteria bacterium]|nr:GIY-YIG nuclease family protein [Candidatus Paceibacterota bacterium]